MDLVSVRDGDSAATNNSLSLDTVTQTGFERSHEELHDSEDSMNQVRLYLLDDPPPPPPRSLASTK